MDQLHAAVLQSQRLLSPAPQDAAKRILLLDCDHRRRHVRAEALAERGVFVDRAAETAVARTLWKPGTYDLVLIDLRGADTDCAAFIAFVQGECAQQKFGFYVAQHPYLTVSAAECRSSMQRQALRHGATHQPPSAVPTRSHGGTNLAVAVRRIADLRRSASFRAAAHEEPPAAEVRVSGTSASDAVLYAARVLGGS